MHALPGFLNDETSQEILVSHGIVKIIVNCLERNLKSSMPLTDLHTYVKCRQKDTEERIYHPSSSKKKKMNDSIQVSC